MNEILKTLINVCVVNGRILQSNSQQSPVSSVAGVVRLCRCFMKTGLVVLQYVAVHTEHPLLFEELVY